MLSESSWVSWSWSWSVSYRNKPSGEGLFPVLNVDAIGNHTDNVADVQVSCMKLLDQYIPPRWIMCLESVAHLLVMVNFSTNFLIYCSVSKQFKTVLSTVCVLCFPRHSPSLLSNPQVAQ